MSRLSRNIAMGPRPRDGRRTPVASLFDRSARKFGDRRQRHPQSPDVHVGWLSDRLGARRMPHMIFLLAWRPASGDLRATKSQQSPVNLRDVDGHATSAVVFG